MFFCCFFLLFFFYNEEFENVNEYFVYGCSIENFGLIAFWVQFLNIDVSFDTTIILSTDKTRQENFSHIFDSCFLDNGAEYSINSIRVSSQL